MRYLVKLKPLKPFFFGGDVTFGKLGDDENGTYLAHSRLFPQQSAILGMLRKEILLQQKLLTTKMRGEWVDKNKSEEAKKLVGDESFDIISNSIQNFGVIKNISPVFLMNDDKRFIKRANVGNYEDELLKVYKNGKLENYNPKEDILDNFISIDDEETLKTEDIFKPITQIGIKKIINKSKDENKDAFYKKTSYLFQEKDKNKNSNDFYFAFYLDIDINLESSFIKLGADDSIFKMEVKESNEQLNYKDNFLLLLSDALITIPLKNNSKKNCDFAVTREISYQNLKTKVKKGKYKFKKSEKIYLYERGSIIINPSKELLKNLENRNLQKIGYNITTGGKK
jgi:CRISPR-associated protein Cmr3